MSRKRTTESSLELLLDTICNTFGGVLFIAILICVLLRMTSPSESTVDDSGQASPQAMLVLEQQLETMVDEIETAQLLLTQQQSISDQLARPDQQAELEALREKRTERDTLVAQRLAVVGDLHASRRRTMEIEKQMADMTASTKTAQRTLQDLQGDTQKLQTDEAQLAIEADDLLKALAAANVRTAPLPRQRTTSKQEIGLIVRFDRVYVWHRYDRIGLPSGLNTDEFVVVAETGGAARTMPKPYAGVPLAEPDTAAQIATRLQSFNSREQYFAVVIWGDSFDTFQTLKNTLVGLGFEYRLMPVVDGESVYDRGGTGGKVQ